MAQNNSFTALFPNTDMSDFIENYQSVPQGMKKILEIQRKNLQSLSEAQKLTTDNMLEIACRQNQVFSEIVQQNSDIANRLISNKKPEDALSSNAVAIQESYEKALATAKEISDMVKKTNAEASGILRKRIAASMKEVQNSPQKTVKEAT